MEVIGILLLLGTFCLGLVICYIFLQYLGTVRQVERHQQETLQKLAQIQGRLDEMSSQGAERIQKVET